MTENTLNPFFDPKGIVVVGASGNPTKLGFALARNLAQSGYTGAIHYVNPKGGVLFEHPVYSHLADVPDPVDLAVILIPAAQVAGVLVQCGQRGIRAAIIASGGFREIGETGAALERECLQVAQAHSIRLIGPNCIGLMDTHLPLDTTFLAPPGPTAGDVAFISHSGAICAVVVDWARGQGFGLSRLVSLGNQADVCESDVLAPVAADPHTRVITLYLEGVTNGRNFVAAAQAISRHKPIVALKVGRSASGQQAVASHTGALAGQETAYSAAFRRAGVIRARSSEQLFDWARALAWCPRPNGRNVAVLTNAGGPGVTAADAIEEQGLRLATLSAETEAALRQVLPPAASVRNPVDMLAGASPEKYATCLQILLKDDNVHSVLVILPPPPVHAAGGVARAMMPTIYTATKPVMIALMGERMIQEAVEYFRAARVPEYRFPERAVAALAVLTRWAKFAARAPSAPISLENEDKALVQSVLARQPTGFLPQTAVRRILAAYGIPTPPAQLAQTAMQAVEIAAQIGLPVALKIASPDILHKSDMGGVLLDLQTTEAVADGFFGMMRRAQATNPQATIEGAQVQRMISQGQDVIVGVTADPQFGPVVMFGSGGVEVEGLKDVAFALAPLTAEDAEDLLARTWAGRKLAGYRHLPVGDKTAVLDTLHRLSHLAADFPQLTEIEINPLRVLPAGNGAFAVDGRMRLGGD